LERGDCDSSWPEAAGVEFRRPSLDWHWNFWLVGVRAPPSSDCRNYNSCCLLLSTSRAAEIKALVGQKHPSKIYGDCLHQVL